jgi:alkylation response protein AidB-like acyl-CoA dehydrogenase
MSEREALPPVARAQALAPAIAAASEAIERGRSIPEPLLARLHQGRLFRLLLPHSVGGEQTDPRSYVAAIEELARHDASVAWNVFVANSAALIAAYLDLRTARTIFADENALIAWGPPNGVRALAVDGGYRVDGTWQFASGCRHASWLGAHCLVVSAAGVLRQGAGGRPAVRTLLFPRREARIAYTWNAIGLCGTGSESYAVKDLFVPEAFSCTREDPSARREAGPLYAFTMQGLYAVGVAGVALGVARAMLDAFIALAKSKAPRGKRRLADDAVIRADVARAEAKLGAARAYLFETLASVYQHADAIAPIGIAERARVRLAATHAIHAAIAVADDSYKASGVDAIVPGGAFERRFRDIHTLSQQIQARTAHFEAVGEVLLGALPEVFF